MNTAYLKYLRIFLACLAGMLLLAASGLFLYDGSAPDHAPASPDLPEPAKMAKAAEVVEAVEAMEAWLWHELNELRALRAAAPTGDAYPWLDAYDPANSAALRVPAPAGFDRIPAKPGSFGAWLRYLPLKPGHPPVRLYTGELKPEQDEHWAVVDLDVGPKDLQHCADAIIRLRAEYLFTKGAARSISFDFTSGHTIDFERWLSGHRPAVRGDRVEWTRAVAAAPSRAELTTYLDVIFIYAGTLSLEAELEPVTDPGDIRIGDVFIRGGSPGHAVLVVDVARRRGAEERVFLLAESNQPAQDMHIVRNPTGRALDPWFSIRAGDLIVTPRWTFTRDDLRRFPASQGSGDS